MSERALRARDVSRVIIDLINVHEVTSSAFARLVLLRRELLRRGQDLRITGMHGRAARLYEIMRLARVLPQESPNEILPWVEPDRVEAIARH